MAAKKVLDTQIKTVNGDIEQPTRRFRSESDGVKFSHSGIR